MSIADRHVAETDIHQGQRGFMLADRRFALAFELAVEQGELPGGRGLLRQDAVAAAEEAQILGLVGDLVQARQARADVEIHVAEIIVLRAMEADADRACIALADLEIDVAHRRIEGAGIGVGDLGIGRHAAGRREGHAERRGVRAASWRWRPGRKPAKITMSADALGEARRVVAQHEHRAVRAPADHPHRRPDIDGAA